MEVDFLSGLGFSSQRLHRFPTQDSHRQTDACLKAGELTSIHHTCVFL